MEQFSKRRLVRIPLTSTHRANRLLFARQHLTWDIRDWSTVLFTYECKVNFFSDDRRISLWRSEGERFSVVCIHESDRFGGLNNTLWGGISMSGRTELVILNEGTTAVQHYVEVVIWPLVVPHAQKIGARFYLMHDNARAHSARTTREALQETGIKVLPWPANSTNRIPSNTSCGIYWNAVFEAQIKLGTNASRNSSIPCRQCTSQA